MSLPISFISDFGLDDEFVGVVHGVLAKLAPGARVIDIGHKIDRGNIRSAALSLTRAVQYLPEGVCLAVVDPGVGSDRRAIAAKTPWGYFVGPDNGVLSPAVAMVGGAETVVSIENPEGMIPSPGATFAGRDVFAPAAALLASGETVLGELGPEVDGDELTPLLLPLTESDDTSIVGEAWWVDAFGNVQTNIAPEEAESAGLVLGEVMTVKIGTTLHSLTWASTYSDVEEGEGLIHVDSAGLLAIAVRGGRAEESFGLREGMSVTLSGRGSAKPG